MKHEILVKYLSENEFKLDQFGRAVIEDEKILEAINGAAGSLTGMDSTRSNGACYNSGCH